MIKPSLKCILSCTLCTTVAQANLNPGDVLGFDFGSVEAADTNYNFVTKTAGSTTTTITNAIKLNDGSSSSVTFSVDGIQGSNTGNGQNIQGEEPASSVYNVYHDIIFDADGDNQFTFTFSGLDDSMLYSIFGGGKRNASLPTTWHVGDQSEEVTPVGNVTDLYRSFEQLTTDGAGNITFTVTDGEDAANAIFFSELSITAFSNDSTDITNADAQVLAAIEPSAHLAAINQLSASAEAAATEVALTNIQTLIQNKDERFQGLTTTEEYLEVINDI